MKKWALLVITIIIVVAAQTWATSAPNVTATYEAVSSGYRVGFTVFADLPNGGTI